MFPKKNTILIYILNPDRDFLGLYCVGELLRTFYGFHTVYCNDYTVLEAIEHYRPVASFLTYASSDFTQLLCRRALSHGRCFLLGSERGEENVKRHIASFARAPKSLRKEISRIFTMGDRDRRLHLNHDIYDESQVTVAGNLNHDFLLFSPHGTTKADIGIALTGVVMNPRRLRGPVELIYRQATKLAVPKPKIDSTLHPIIAMGECSATLEFFKLACWMNEDKKRLKIIARPHPWERASSYKMLRKRLQDLHISVDNKLFLHQWLSAVRVILHCNSSTSLEAFIMNKPAISIFSMLPELVRSSFLHYFGEQYRYLSWQWNPRDKDECYDLIYKALGNELSPCPPEYLSEYRSYVQDWFNINRAEPAARLIARTIVEDLGDSVENGVGTLSVSAGLKYWLALVRGLRADSLDMLRTYFNFRVREEGRRFYKNVLERTS